MTYIELYNWNYSHLIIRNPIMIISEDTILTFFNAIQNDDTKKVRFMVNKEPSLIHQTHGFRKRTPIHTCVSVNMLKIIIELGATINGDSSQWDTPLAKFVKQNSIASVYMIKTLVDLGADVNQIDILGRNAFFYASYDMMNILKDIGTDINLQDARGETPLHHLCESMISIRSIDKVLENGGDPRIKSDRGETPLEVLAKNERFYPGDKTMFYEILCKISMKSKDLDDNERRQKIWMKRREFALVVFSHGERESIDNISRELNLEDSGVLGSLIHDGMCGDGYSLFDDGKPWGRLIMEYI